MFHNVGTALQWVLDALRAAGVNPSDIARVVFTLLMDLLSGKTKEQTLADAERMFSTVQLRAHNPTNPGGCPTPDCDDAPPVKLEPEPPTS